MTPADLARLTAAIDHARSERDAAIVQAAKEGMPQTEIVRATGLTQERVRQIERAAGLPPRKPGRRPGPTDTN